MKAAGLPYTIVRPPTDGNHQPVALPRMPTKPARRKQKELHASTLLHHIVNGADFARRWSNGGASFVELTVHVSEGVFRHLCAFDADGCPDLEQDFEGEENIGTLPVTPQSIPPQLRLVATTR